MKKYSLEEVMTPGDAAKIYGVTIDQIRNRLKPSRIGKENVDASVKRGIIRYSDSTWLLTTDFMEMHFGKKK